MEPANERTAPWATVPLLSPLPRFGSEGYPRSVAFQGAADGWRQASQLYASPLHVLEHLSTIVDEQNDTAGHPFRVRDGALLLAALLDIPDLERAAIGMAAQFHDIGKLMTPRALLRKPGPLTAAEYMQVREHAVHGATLVRAVLNSKYVACLIRHHHERWAGSGYPDGLAGDSIPRGAQIIAVCDVWDALISDRPYRAAMSRAEAQAVMLAGRATQFDPFVLDAFLNLIYCG